MSYKYNSQNREDWLTSIHPRFSSDKWSNEIAYHPSEIKHNEFFKEVGFAYEDISPQQICGLEYDPWSYNSPYIRGNNYYSWLMQLHKLKRLDGVIDNFKTRDSLIRHIQNDKDSKAVKQYGSCYFITSGQHRLCLAKLIELESIRVCVHKYELDRNLFSRELNIEKNIPFLFEKGFLQYPYKREMRNDFLSLYGRKKETVYIKKDMVKYLVNRYKILEEDPLKRLFSILRADKSKNGYLDIKTEEDLRYLDSVIRYKIKHFRNNDLVSDKSSVQLFACKKDK